MVKNKKVKESKKKYLVIVMIILAAGIVIASRAISIENKDQNNFENTANTTSTAATAQPDFNDGTEREAVVNNTNEGTVTDTSGNFSVDNGTEASLRSGDGKISLLVPTKDSIIRSSDAISGFSEYPAVSFRLIDDVSGVIARGELQVVDGKFSGEFNFSSNASRGRLDVFSANPDGTEESNLSVDIRFK